jgi:hypothetical protein
MIHFLFILLTYDELLDIVNLINVESKITYTGFYTNFFNPKYKLMIKSKYTKLYYNKQNDIYKIVCFSCSVVSVKKIVNTIIELNNKKIYQCETEKVATSLKTINELNDYIDTRTKYGFDHGFNHIIGLSQTQRILFENIKLHCDPAQMVKIIQ